MRWRRIWLDEEKGRIVAEIASSGDTVCAVARRNGLSPQQLFGWRRRLRMPKLRLRKRVGWSSYPRLLMRIGLQSRRRVTDLVEPIGRIAACGAGWSRSLSAGLRTPVADLPFVPNLDSEILDPPSRFQLRDQPARPFAATGPSLWRLIRIEVFGEYRRVRPTPRRYWSLQPLQSLFQSQFFLLDSLLQQLRNLNMQRPKVVGTHSIEFGSFHVHPFIMMPQASNVHSINF
jgi:Transposase